MARRMEEPIMTIEGKERIYRTAYGAIVIAATVALGWPAVVLAWYLSF